MKRFSICITFLTLLPLCNPNTASGQCFLAKRKPRCNQANCCAVGSCQQSIPCVVNECPQQTASVYVSETAELSPAIGCDSFVAAEPVVYQCAADVTVAIPTSSVAIVAAQQYIEPISACQVGYQVQHQAEYQVVDLYDGQGLASQPALLTAAEVLQQSSSDQPISQVDYQSSTDAITPSLRSRIADLEAQLAEATEASQKHAAASEKSQQLVDSQETANENVLNEMKAASMRAEKAESKLKEAQKQLVELQSQMKEAQEEAALAKQKSMQQREAMAQRNAETKKSVGRIESQLADLKKQLSAAQEEKQKALQAAKQNKLALEDAEKSALQSRTQAKQNADKAREAAELATKRAAEAAAEQKRAYESAQDKIVKARDRAIADAKKMNEEAVKKANIDRAKAKDELAKSKKTIQELQLAKKKSDQNAVKLGEQLKKQRKQNGNLKKQVEQLKKRLLESQKKQSDDAPADIDI